MRIKPILGDQWADSGGEGKSKRAEKYGTKKSKERREEPLGTMSYQTSSKRSPPFSLLIEQKNTKVFWHQSVSLPLSAPGSPRMYQTQLSVWMNALHVAEWCSGRKIRLELK